MSDFDFSLPFRYVAYDVDGTLTGCYIQVLAPEHVDCFIAVDDSYVWTWTGYRANAARDGVELIPPEPTLPEDPGVPVAAA